MYPSRHKDEDVAVHTQKTTMSTGGHALNFVYLLELVILLFGLLTAGESFTLYVG